MIFQILRIILTIIIVHYGTNLFDILSCEEISPNEDVLPEYEPTTRQIINYMTVGALIAVAILMLLALCR